MKTKKTNKTSKTTLKPQQEFLQIEPIEVQDADLLSVVGGMGCSKTSTYNNVCIV